MISFVGRHNEVKGYDLLIELYTKIDDAYFVCCGKKGRIKCPEDKRWIEIGWTEDPYSYVNASDLFILPNRETYFDLSLLQTISIGKTALISNTGGNKYFKGREDAGIFVFDNIEDACKIIKYLKSRETIEEESKHMKELYSNYFTNEMFYQKYIKTMMDIYEDHRKNGE